jgi:hypothetical protein
MATAIKPKCWIKFNTQCSQTPKAKITNWTMFTDLRKELETLEHVSNSKIIHVDLNAWKIIPPWSKAMQNRRLLCCQSMVQYINVNNYP